MNISPKSANFAGLSKNFTVHEVYETTKDYKIDYKP